MMQQTLGISLTLLVRAEKQSSLFLRRSCSIIVYPLSTPYLFFARLIYPVETWPPHYLIHTRRFDDQDWLGGWAIPVADLLIKLNLRYERSVLCPCQCGIRNPWRFGILGAL